jgi:integrase
MPRLTKTSIDAATATGADSFVWDSDVPGFGIRVRASGRKTFVIRYRNGSGSSRYYTIARTCDMAPAEARDAARALFVAIKAGVDPSEKRSRARGEISVSDLFDVWIETYAVARYKPSSLYQARSLFRRHIADRLGRRPAGSITRSDVLDLHVALRRGPSIANQVVSILGSMYRNAVERGILDHNPAERIKWYAQRERARILDPAEIQRILVALDGDRFTPAFRRLIKLLMLTGARLSEIRDARMDWIDTAARILSLPDSKTGAKVIALPDAAMPLIAERAGHTWLVEARIGAGHMKSTWAAWCALLDAAGLERGIRIHDIRHTVGSLGHRAGLSQREVAIQLGHRSLRTTERYTKGQRGIERDVADRVADVMGVR